jgi:hypothetical protein
MISKSRDYVRSKGQKTGKGKQRKKVLQRRRHYKLLVLMIKFCPRHMLTQGPTVIKLRVFSKEFSLQISESENENTWIIFSLANILRFKYVKTENILSSPIL